MHGIVLLCLFVFGVFVCLYAIVAMRFACIVVFVYFMCVCGLFYVLVSVRLYVFRGIVFVDVCLCFILCVRVVSF